MSCRTSIGASIFPEHANSAEEALKHADLALYAAKSTRRGSFQVFSPAMGRESKRRQTMMNLGRKALIEDLIRPYYQPKVDMQTGRIVGFEALLRIEEISGRLRRPKSVAACFEDYELSCSIGERMMSQVLCDLARWKKAGFTGHIAINASAEDFKRGNLGELLLSKLAENDIKTNQVQLEVTETVFLGRGADHVAKALKIISEAGVQIALDDFGTGYASLTHLQKFPVHILKIDRSFVRRATSKSGNQAIVKSIIGLAEGLGLDIVAEGIETRAQHMVMRNLGCTTGQGYYYGRPASARDAMSFIPSI